MRLKEINRVRPRLEAFAAEMFAGMPRRDQRAKGELYVRGLMLDGQRKSMQPMGERLGVDHQQLQQFVSSSTWEHTDVRRRLATWVQDVVSPEAHVIDDVGFPKDGLDSPGVARQYCGTLGKTGNCQIGVSMHLVTDRASAAVNWRLFLPQRWDPATLTDPAAVQDLNAVDSGARSLMRWGIGRSGGWPWRCSMSTAHGGWRIGWWSVTPATAISLRFA